MYVTGVSFLVGGVALVPSLKATGLCSRNLDPPTTTTSHRTERVTQMTTKLPPDDLLLMEQATLKAPVDTFRRLQKMTQKTFEHNLGPASAFSKDLDSLLRKSASAPSPIPDPTTQADMLKTVDGMLSRMRGLKRKLSDLSNQCTTATNVANTRLSHLSTLPETMESPSYQPWARRRLSHHLADYMLRSVPPLKETAKALADEEGITHMVDFEVWEELAKAEDGLRAGRLDEVLGWAGENRNALRKMKSPLEFTIHMQAYIELCRSRSLAQAIAYAKKHLSPTAAAEVIGGNPKQMQELSRVMGLLAFAPETTCSLYQDLYSADRWTTLLALFRSTFLSLHSLPSLPLLHLSLQAGISSLKTPICCPLPTSTPGATEGRVSSECPICSSPLKDLAPEVPYSHHVNSTIVCGLSGKVVEGGDGGGGELVAMISPKTLEGRVYSKEALAMRVSMHPEHKLIEPQTGEVFEWDELKKVFIS